MPLLHHLLSVLLADYHLAQQPALAFPITGLSVDTRSLQKGEVFLAYPGESQDGREHIAEAIQKGASAILCEPSDKTWESPIPIILFPQLREHVGALAAGWFHYPTRDLNVYGITGTNGKTSCSHYLAQALALCHQHCAVLGTVGTGFIGALKPSALTTPCALDLQRIMAECLAEGAKALAMEVSSHALVQGRVNAVEFNTAIFTNLTQDHLDYHGTMEAYGAAKAKLFNWTSLKRAVINVDDDFGLVLFKELQQQPALELLAYTTRTDSDIAAEKLIRADILKEDKTGLTIMLYTPWGNGECKIPLLGRFNLYNVLAVVAAISDFIKEDFSKIPIILSQLKPVPGRMECLGGGDKPLVVVDYAHTPDALKKVLSTLQDYEHDNLYCVFGCGGDRDPIKRPMMGKIAAEYADQLIVTNDNPRTENPEKIVQDILQGIPKNQKLTVEYDREKAIINAINDAKTGDIILIAGKGHEDYQIIGNQRLHFSDVEIVKKGLGL